MEPVVLVKPASDRIAREPDDAAAKAMDFGHKGLVDPVQMEGQFLGPASGTHGPCQGFRQGREARNICKQRGTPGAMGQLFSPPNRLNPIPRNVCVK